MEAEENYTPEWVFKALTLIQGKFASAGRSEKLYTAAEEIYRVGMLPLDPVIGMSAVKELCFTSARPPDIAEIVLLHAQMVSPIPSWEDAWAEVQDKLGVPATISYMEDGAFRRKPNPKAVISSPIILRAVADMGGMEEMWDSYRWAEKPTPLSILRSQFREFYKSRAAEHTAEVVKIVNRHGVPAGRELYPELFPVPERDGLPAVTKYRPVSSLPESGRSLSVPKTLPRAEEKAVPCPPEILKQLRAIGLGNIGKQFPEPALKQIEEGSEHKSRRRIVPARK